MSGTACSRRLRAGESQSYTVAELAGDQLSLAVRGGFREVRTTAWHRSPDGWHR